MISIIIPAHNEENVIERCLDGLFESGADEKMEVIVACNGCTDRTAEIASSYGSRVQVLDIATPSKNAALNAGDKAAKGFPRFYIDADVVVSAEAIARTARYLSRPGIEAAAPQIEIDMADCNWAARSFYKVWNALPYFTGGSMIGSGIYAVSKLGRSRFESFPKIISDDGFVRSLFTSEECKTVPNCSFRISAPKTLEGVIKIKSRSRFGRVELAQKFPENISQSDNSSKDLVRVVIKNPRLIPCLPVYVYVWFKTKQNVAARLEKQDYTTWERDDTSRLTDPQG